MKTCVITRAAPKGANLPSSEWGVRIAVSDNGPGIEKVCPPALPCPVLCSSVTMNFQEKLSTFFDTLFPGDPYQEASDGYSLVINKRIVDLHKGKIGVESAGFGEGATFYISLPSKLPSSRRNSAVALGIASGQQRRGSTAALPSPLIGDVETTRSGKF